MFLQLNLFPYSLAFTSSSALFQNSFFSFLLLYFFPCFLHPFCLFLPPYFLSYLFLLLSFSTSLLTFLPHLYRVLSPHTTAQLFSNFLSPSHLFFSLFTSVILLVLSCFLFVASLFPSLPPQFLSCFLTFFFPSLHPCLLPYYFLFDPASSAHPCLLIFPSPPRHCLAYVPISSPTFLFLSCLPVYSTTYCFFPPSALSYTFYVTLYIYSTTIQHQIMYFSLHFIHFAASVNIFFFSIKILIRLKNTLFRMKPVFQNLSIL